MAFDFLDLFPDSQAAVVGSQGARDILENQYKQAMGALELENALLRSVQAQKDFNNKQAQEPLAKTIEAVKLMQGLNISGSSPLQGVDLSDQAALQAAILKEAQSGNIKTDLDAEILKEKIKTEASTAKAMEIQSAQTGRNNADNAAELNREMRKAAIKHANDLLEDYPKPLSPTQAAGRKGQSLVAAYNGLLAYGDPQAARIFWNRHSNLLSAAGFDAPGGGSRKAPAAQAPAAPSAPAAPAPQAPQAQAPQAMQTLKRGEVPQFEGQPQQEFSISKEVGGGFEDLGNWLMSGSPKPAQPAAAPQKPQALEKVEVINGVKYVLKDGKYVKVK